MNIEKIVDSVLAGCVISREEALTLLNVENKSTDFYKILSVANRLTRQNFNNKAYIFAQIGINAEPCTKNCKFCSMGKDHYSMESKWRKDYKTVSQEVDKLIEANIDDLFLMTTADYPIDDFLAIAEKVKKKLPPTIKFVANIGDFDVNIALKLKQVGFTGVYHIHRLKEGIDTDIEPETRIKTLDAIVTAGLDLYYCVEPIGPEHSYQELMDEMMRARDYHVKVMAVMRRIPVPGTPLHDKGQITALELAKIAAVTRIVSLPSRAMNAHEVTPLTLLGGVNQLYAEVGANPRDNNSNTEKNRGVSVSAIKKLLSDVEYDI
ncbi:radical SAM protein [Sporomusa sp. KB1]|jgi:biotin synthase|uniref:radical SAM protein n=1 Tax=Sporomusa sp. KB1 TaxID=943346 RepID=UPI0011AA1301|nr:radical SAM protein [Sporomusa sp. KB1]TWH48712.1 biotin synthase [Sporomusa sp. KB1]